MDLHEMLKQLLEREKMGDKKIEETWTQVSKLTPEDTLTRRNLQAKFSEAHREIKLLKKRADKIEADMDFQSTEYWNHIYKAYGLPHGNYHIADDGRIFREPENS